MGELQSAIDAHATVPPRDLDEAALSRRILESIRERDRLNGLIAADLADHDRRMVWKAEGAHSQKQWLADRGRMTRGEAGAAADTARRLAQLPQTMTALTDGTITSSQAQAAAQAVRDLPPDAVRGLDQLVVEHGPDVDAGQLRAAVNDYAHRTAPDSLEQRQERAYRLRRLRLAKTPDDATVVEGRLDLLGGEMVLTALAPLAGLRDGDDTRTSEQRMADALVELCRRSLTQGDLPEVGGVRPHVTVVVALETLEGRAGAAPALLDRLGAVCGETARMLACDAGVARVITQGESQPLDVGRTTRTVSPAQRKALAVRDRGCIGCRAPASWCEAHHVRHWFEHGGPTDLNNLILVCWRCHRDIHHGGRQPIRGPDGRWALRAPMRGGGGRC